MDLKPIHTGQCHCGAVKFTVNLPNGLEKLRRCDCSMCRRRGAIVASVTLPNLSITAGNDILRLYQFNTHTAKHYFCSNCGIYTHHQRRSDPTEFGINVGCLDGINPYELGEVPVSDGVNHPADRLTARVATQLEEASHRGSK